MATPAHLVEEVRAHRRRLSAAYQRRILEEAEPGALGALLRRERLYASHLTTRRAQRATGIQAGLRQARGRKPPPAAVQERDRLRAENARWRAELARAREIDGQGKVSGLLRQLPSPVSPPSVGLVAFEDEVPTGR
jgi:transposase